MTGSQPARMTEAEFRALYDQLRRHVRWGADDRRGALNQIAAAQIQAAAGEVKLGRTVSLAAPIEDEVSADNPDPAQHRMVQAPGTAKPGLAFAADRIAMNVHGNADSHIDALCHVSFDGHLYNGVPANAVTATGADELSIAVAASGIAGRGVLLDVPRSRGVPWLEPGGHVTIDDLLAAEHGQRVRMAKGDIVLVRVGHRLRRREQGPWDAAGGPGGVAPGRPAAPGAAPDRGARQRREQRHGAERGGWGRVSGARAGDQRAGGALAGLPAVGRTGRGVREGGALVVPVRCRAVAAADVDGVAG